MNYESSISKEKVLVGPAQADWDGDTEPPEAIGSEAVQTVAEDNPEPP